MARRSFTLMSALAALMVAVLALTCFAIADARPLKQAHRPTPKPKPIRSRPAPAPPTGPIDDPVCDPTRRTDCGYVGINQQQCQAKGCCWQPTSSETQQPTDIPWCFYKVGPPPVYSISSASPTANGYTFVLTVNDESSGSISPLQTDVTYDTEDRIHIKIYDPNNVRWEIPQNVLPYPGAQHRGGLNYQFSYGASPVWFAVTRNVDGEVLFNISSLQFQDQFLSVTTPLGPAPRVYGIGEHVDPLLLNTFNQHTYTLWNADVPTPPDQNIYGSHPFYLEIRGDQGNTHGVFLRNSNGMDIVLNHDPNPYAQYNVDGGVLDFFVMIGPDPKAAVAQYHAVIGTPHMPPYWALGWHQCKYGWPNLQTLKNVVSNYSAAGIPLDTMWSDIDHMQNYEDFSFDPVNYPPAQMNQWVQQLHADGQHYVVIVDPGIHTRTGYAPYDDGLKEGIFIMQNDGVTPFVGTVWPGQTSFPDWFNPNTQAYWSNAISTFLAEVPIDGLWIDMNEISNFGNGESDHPLPNGPNNPPYAINNFNNHSPLNTKTIAMDCLHYPYNSTYYEYNTHNLFGMMESIATRTALEQLYGKRSFVLTRSTFAGSGHHVAHWLGDNYASFDSMAASIPGILDMNIYGVPLVGSDICGFLNPTTEELCARWSALGAFYPFSRNHHDIHSGDQEPYMWASVTRVAKQTLGARYSLLPYYYTLFYQAWKYGGTVARPLFFEFPGDDNTIIIDQQFLIGAGLLITPVLTQGATSVTGYFPPAALWYDFWTGNALGSSGSVTLQAPMEYLPLHVRGGVVFPMQQPAMTTAATRQLPFELLVALTANGTASGSMYVDDGESLSVDAQSTYLTFAVSGGALTATVQSATYSAAPNFANVNVWGVDSVSAVTVNGQNWSQYTFNAATSVLAITGLNLPITQSFTIQW